MKPLLMPSRGIVRAGRLKRALSGIAELIGRARGTRATQADGSVSLRLPDDAVLSQLYVTGGGGIYKITPGTAPSGSDGRVLVPTIDGEPLTKPHAIRVEPPAWFCVAWENYLPVWPTEGDPVTWHHAPRIVITREPQPPQDITALLSVTAGVTSTDSGTAYTVLAYLDTGGVLHQFYYV